MNFFLIFKDLMDLKETLILQNMSLILKLISTFLSRAVNELLSCDIDELNYAISHNFVLKKGNEHNIKFLIIFF